MRLASSSSNTIAIFLFHVKTLYLAGTTSPTWRFLFQITSTLIQLSVLAWRKWHNRFDPSSILLIHHRFSSKCQQRIYHFLVPHLDDLVELSVFPPWSPNILYTWWLWTRLWNFIWCIIINSQHSSSRALAILLLSKKKVLDCIELFELRVCFESTL